MLLLLFSCSLVLNVMLVIPLNLWRVVCRLAGTQLGLHRLVKDRFGRSVCVASMFPLVLTNEAWALLLRVGRGRPPYMIAPSKWQLDPSCLLIVVR